MRAVTVDANAPVESRGREALAPRFGVPFLGFCLLSALLISWWPLQLSIATVFLFAGPHNWVEFRYFIGRMPARWGRSRAFFAVGLGGMFLLTCAYALLYWAGQLWYLSEATWTAVLALWATAFLAWLCALVWLGARRSARRERSWVFAAGSALAAVVWVAPQWFFLALVYAHPLVVLWFLDRQLKRTRPHWRKTYHLCLATLPLILFVMWRQLSDAPNLTDTDALAWRITRHAGAGILSGVSSHLLVSTHVFLEMVHYGVWLVLLPLAGLGSGIFRTGAIPLAVHRRGWPRAVKASLAFGLVVVLFLWACFWGDYATTRDVYFTLAMAHVLAEVPFLLRML